MTITGNSVKLDVDNDVDMSLSNKFFSMVNCMVWVCFAVKGLPTHVVEWLTGCTLKPLFSASDTEIPLNKRKNKTGTAIRNKIIFIFNHIIHVSP